MEFKLSTITAIYYSESFPVLFQSFPIPTKRVREPFIKLRNVPKLPKHTHTYSLLIP